MTTWPLTVWPRQQWHFLWRCAGVLARIVLALLPALSCSCCWRCAGVVAKFAFKGPADAALAFAGDALVSSPALHWHHCQHRAVVSAASIAPALLPFLPSSRAPCGGICPSAVVTLRGVLAVSGVVNALPLFLLPGALMAMYVPFVTMSLSERLTAAAAKSLLPALRRRRRRVGLWRSGRCSAGICWQCTGVLARITLRSSPALRCCRCCWHCAGIVALFVLIVCPCKGVHSFAVITVRGILAISCVVDARPPFSVA
jgi:hypothetical protein